MRSALAIAAALAAGVCGLATAVPAAAAAALVHPFHISVAEAEWKPKTKTLEVSLRLHGVDLETALGKIAAKKVVLEKTPKVDELIAKYLRSRFRVTPAGAEQSGKLTFVGKEVGAKATWLYFEIALPADPAGAMVENTVLLEVLDDQLNTVNFRSGKKRASLTFSKKTKSAPLAWKPAG